MKKYFFYIYFVLATVSYSQDKKYVDSILKIIPEQEGTEKVNSFRRLFNVHFQVDPKLAKPYVDSSMSIAKKMNSTFLIACTTNDYGIYLDKTSDYQNALTEYDKAIVLFKEIGNKEQESASINNKAITLKTLGRHEEAIAAYLISLKIKDESKATDEKNLGNDYWNESIAASLWNIGNVYGEIKNYDKSNEYYRKAEKIYEKLNLEEDLDFIRFLLAVNLTEVKKFDEAIPILENSIKKFESQNYYNDLARANNTLGSIYLETGKIEKAKAYFVRALSLSKEYGVRKITVTSLRNLGEAHMKTGYYNKALDNFNQALKISLEIDTKLFMISDYLSLSNAYAAMGNYKLAYDNHRDYTELYKDVLGKENIEKINELEIKYETEKKEQQIHIQNSEIELLNQKAQISSLQRILLGTGLLLSLIGFYAMRQKFKRKKLEKEKLDTELDFKKKELTTHALHLAKKNEVLEGLKQKAEALKSSENSQNGYQQLISTINFDLQDNNNWENFSNYFQQVHTDFNYKVKQKFIEITPNELRLMALIKMNLSTKEIANILNISVPGVKKARQRLRKKMHLSTNDSLEDAILDI